MRNVGLVPPSCLFQPGVDPRTAGAGLPRVPHDENALCNSFIYIITNASNAKASAIKQMQTARGCRGNRLLKPSKCPQEIRRPSRPQAALSPLCPSPAPLLVSCHMAQPAHPDLSAGSARLPELLASRENRWLKQFRTALSGEPLHAPQASSSARGPAAEDIVGIEGLRLVETALHTPSEIIAVLVSDSGSRHLPPLAALIPHAAHIFRTTDRLFAHISGTEAPQGIAALLRPRTASFDDLVRGIPLVVIMAGLQDPGNVGALVRTAEAFGATGVAACLVRSHRHRQSLRSEGAARFSRFGAAAANCSRHRRARHARAIAHRRSARVRRLPG